MSQLVYRPYHAITHHNSCCLHIVDSFGAIVNRLLLPEWKHCACCNLTEKRLVIFFNAVYPLHRCLNVFDTTTFTLLKSVPYETSCVGLLQLRNEKIIVLTFAQGFHIYSNKLEFEQQVNHDGILIEGLCELPNGNIVTANTQPGRLHIWNTTTWTEQRTVNLYKNDRLVEIVHWKHFKVIGVTRTNYFVYDLESDQVDVKIQGDFVQMKSPIVLQNTFLWQHCDRLRMYGKMNEIKSDWLPALAVRTDWSTFYDGRVLLQTTDKIIEFIVDDTIDNEECLIKLRTRRNLNDFRLFFAFHTKQDDELLVKQLDPFVRDFIPIFDLRSIVYSFI